MPKGKKRVRINMRKDTGIRKMHVRPQYLWGPNLLPSAGIGKPHKKQELEVSRNCLCLQNGVYPMGIFL